MLHKEKQGSASSSIRITLVSQFTSAAAHCTAKSAASMASWMKSFTQSWNTAEYKVLFKGQALYQILKHVLFKEGVIKTAHRVGHILFVLQLQPLEPASTVSETHKTLHISRAGLSIQLLNQSLSERKISGKISSPQKLTICCQSTLLLPEERHGRVHVALHLEQVQHGRIEKSILPLSQGSDNLSIYYFFSMHISPRRRS